MDRPRYSKQLGKAPYILLIAALLPFSLKAQVLKSSTGEASFYSEAPLEDIEAKTLKAKAAVNIETGEVAVVIPIKSFDFHKELMKEHFNENYLESQKYPDATFKGKLDKIPDFSPGKTETMTVTGNLTIHGVTQKRTFPVTITYSSKDKMGVNARFIVALKDHEIEIPELVFQKIAEEVAVTVNFLFER
jgi:polyisoprenoid-binding protein YceI